MPIVSDKKCIPLGQAVSGTTDLDAEKRLYLPFLMGEDGVPFVRQVYTDTDGNSANLHIAILNAEITGGGLGYYGILSASANMVFTGDNSAPTEISRQRGNTIETILASTARTASVNSSDFTNYNNRGAHFIINVSAIAATPSVVFTIQGKDPVSNNYYDILVSSAITTTGTTVLKVYPGIGAIANGAASDILPATFRVIATHADADSITYSVGCNLVV